MPLSESQQRSPSVEVRHAVGSTDAPDAATIAAWVERAIAATGLDDVVSVSVSVIGPEEMRALNHDYRNVDRPTNVLAFPAGNIAGLPPGEARPIGDVAICAEVVREEAAAQQKTVDAHWAHMLVHGTLHLLGYDHERAADAEEMEALERHILAEHGIADPYRVP